MVGEEGLGETRMNARVNAWRIDAIKVAPGM